MFIAGWVTLLLPLVLSQDDAISQLLPKGTENTAESLEAVRKILSRLNPKVQARKGLFNQRISSENILPSTDEINEANRDLEDYLFEGDILLNVEQATAIVEANSNNTRLKRQYSLYQSLWSKSRPIYYTMEGFGSDGIVAIRQAAEFWTRMTCLNFVEHPWASPRLRFVPLPGCWSSIGRQNGLNSQDISLGLGCQTFAAAAHELGHALGYYHTQSRPDRDNFVAINFGNVPVEKFKNFVKVPDELGTSRHISYDYGSIMQYSPYAFASNPFVPTVLARDSRFQSTMGKKPKPSFADVKGINSIYQCHEACASPPRCQNYGIVDSKTCNSCICPPQFAGAYCNSLNRGTAPVCNSQVLQAGGSWTSFRGELSSSGKGYMEECHWLIYAPAGRRVQLRFVTLYAQYCDTSCTQQAVEINPGTFDLTGMRFCCSSGTTVESLGQVMSLSGYARSGSVQFDVQYAAI